MILWRKPCSSTFIYGILHRHLNITTGYESACSLLICTPRFVGCTTSVHSVGIAAMRESCGLNGPSKCLLVH